MPSIISTIGYITEVNTTISTNSDTTITRGIIACNRPEQNGPYLLILLNSVIIMIINSIEVSLLLLVLSVIMYSIYFIEN